MLVDFSFYIFFIPLPDLQMLNFKISTGRSRDHWLQVDLRNETKVIAIVTQGWNSHYVKSYKISFGNTTDTLQFIQNDEGNDIVS